jgi:hypothetical protein
MAVFDGVRYYLSPTLSQHYSQELASILDSNAGEPVDKVEDATHVISNTDRFDGWQAVAEGAFICTVGNLVLDMRLLTNAARSHCG